MKMLARNKPGEATTGRDISGRTAEITGTSGSEEGGIEIMYFELHMSAFSVNRAECVTMMMII